MIGELLMKGYGIYVWSAFLFTLFSFLVLFLITKTQYVKEKSKCKGTPNKNSVSIHINYFSNHNLSKPLFLIFISSVLYFIKKINNENRANAAVMISKGTSIEE